MARGQTRKRRVPSANQDDEFMESRAKKSQTDNTNNEGSKAISPAKKLVKLVSCNKLSAETELVKSLNSEEKITRRTSTRKVKRKAAQSISKYFSNSETSDTELKMTNSEPKVTVSRYFANGEKGLDLDKDSKEYLKMISSKVLTLSDSGSDTESDEDHNLASSSASSLSKTASKSISYPLDIDQLHEGDDSNSLNHSTVALTSNSKKLDVDDDFENECITMTLPKSTAKKLSGVKTTNFKRKELVKEELGIMPRKRGKVVLKTVDTGNNGKEGDSSDEFDDKSSEEISKQKRMEDRRLLNTNNASGKQPGGNQKKFAKIEAINDDVSDSKGKRTTRARKGKKAVSRKATNVIEKSKASAAKGSSRGRGKKTVVLEDEDDLKSDDDSCDSDEDDWEEVAEMPVPVKNQLPDKPVEVILNDPGILSKKRKGVDIESLFKRHWNKVQRETRIMIHKAHLVCLLSIGFRENSVCKSALLQAMALSCVPPNLASVKQKHLDGSFLISLMRWFRGRFTIDASVPGSDKMDEALPSRFEDGKLASEKEMVFILIVVLRCLKFNTRLVTSLRPIPLKPPIAKSKKAAMRKTKESDSSSVDQSRCSTPCGNLAKKLKVNAAADSVKVVSKTKSQQTSKTMPKQTTKTKSQQMPNTPQPKNSRRRNVASKITNHNEGVIEIESDRSKGSGCKQSRPGRRRMKQDKSEEEVDLTAEGSDSSDGDFEVVEETCTRRGQTSKRKKKQKIVSSDSEESVEIVKVKEAEKGTDYWLEVYSENEKKWTCMDCVRGTIGQVGHMEKYATQPLSYILAYDNFSYVRDVTSRYASGWSSETRKLRVDQDWWLDTISPYQCLDEHKNQEEDSVLQVQLLRKPLPTSVAELKNHSLYALKRHLLKFQAIYPESSIPVGYVKGEPVYARECVYELHSRDSWIKEARLVRIGEKPYKMVRARKTKKSQVMNPDQKEQLLEVFGYWQTEEYIPKPPIDGKLPKNDYGNIELFKPSMLPPATVHLKLPGLNKIAKKLDLDCAPAMVGWEVHCGWSHPMLDGFIVCEEHKDIFIAAYDEEEEIRMEKERLKKEKRVFEHWKLLIRGLLIRQRLKNKYNMIKDEPTQPKASGSESIEEIKAKDTKMAWPALRQKGPDKMDKTNLFPFEKL